MILDDQPDTTSEKLKNFLDAFCNIQFQKLLSDCDNLKDNTIIELQCLGCGKVWKTTPTRWGDLIDFHKCDGVRELHYKKFFKS